MLNNPALHSVKEDSRLPDYFGITITYHDKSEDEFKAISHVTKNDMIEIFTTENTFIVIPVNAIRKIMFDKNFTKLQELYAEKIKKEEK